MKAVEEDAPDPSAGWHANLILIDRRNCLLFTHDTTLFTLFVPGVTKPDYKHLPELFGQALFKTMLQFNYSQTQIESMLNQCRELQIGRTNNRSVMGSMNDMKYMIELTVYDRGGLSVIDMGELLKLLNHTPYKAVGYEYPEDKMRALLAG